VSPPTPEPTPPTRRRLPRQVRELQMLDAAVAVFSRRGFHLSSMDDIAEVAGVSKPMIYAYLGSKDDLFIACIRREAQRLMELITAAVPAGLAPHERLRRGLLAFFEFITEHRDGWTVLYRQARVHGTFAGEIAAARERIIVMVAGLLASSSGDDARTRAMPLAHALVGAAEALSDWGLEHPEETPNALATRLMNVIWTGLERADHPEGGSGRR
jgi:AcrR family transcriptional regulator